MKVYRVNRGWQLTWLHGEATAKARLAGAANIGISTVGNMRKRRLVVLATGLEFTGDQSRDSGRVMPITSRPSIDRVRQAAIDTLSRELGILLDPKPHRFTGRQLEVAEATFGQRAWASILDYTRPSEEDELTTEEPPSRAREGNHGGTSTARRGSVEQFGLRASCP